MALHFKAAARQRHSGRVLNANQLNDFSQKCPLCLYGGQRLSTQQIQSNPDIDFLECPRCGGTSASMMPNEYTIDQLYDAFYAEDEDKFTVHEPAAHARRIVDALTIDCFTEPTVRILEVGGGDGALAKEIGRILLEHDSVDKIKIVEVELYKGTDIETGSISVNFVERIEDASGHFEIVLSNAALHQIPELHEVLSGMFERVAVNGYFFASTAFILPIARLAPTGFLDTLYPLNVHDLGPNFWNRSVETFQLNGKLIHSRPSKVETKLSAAPVQTIVAHILKWPAIIETNLRKTGTLPIWNFVGGWEVLIQIDKNRIL